MTIKTLMRRIAVTAFIVVWFGWEVLSTHDQLWMVITGAALACAVWTFFIAFERRSVKSGDDDAKPKS